MRVLIGLTALGSALTMLTHGPGAVAQQTFVFYDLEGNPGCNQALPNQTSEEIKVNPVQAGPIDATDGVETVTYQIDSGTVLTFGKEAEEGVATPKPVNLVIVRSGSSRVWHYGAGGIFGDTGLTAPGNGTISAVTFCYGLEGETLPPPPPPPTPVFVPCDDAFQTAVETTDKLLIVVDKDNPQEPTQLCADSADNPDGFDDCTWTAGQPDSCDLGTGYFNPVDFFLANINSWVICKNPASGGSGECKTGN